MWFELTDGDAPTIDQEGKRIVVPPRKARVYARCTNRLGSFNEEIQIYKVGDVLQYNRTERNFYIYDVSAARTERWDDRTVLSAPLLKNGTTPLRVGDEFLVGWEVTEDGKSFYFEDPNVQAQEGTIATVTIPFPIGFDTSNPLESLTVTEVEDITYSFSSGTFRTSQPTGFSDSLMCHSGFTALSLTDAHDNPSLGSFPRYLQIRYDPRQQRGSSAFVKQTVQGTATISCGWELVRANENEQ